MKNQRNSIDGISLRRRTSVGRLSAYDDTTIPKQFLKEGATAGLERRQQQKPSHTQAGLSRSDIDESLRRFDNEDGGGKKPRKWFLRKKFFKRLFMLLLLVVVLVGGYVGRILRGEKRAWRRQPD